MPIWAIEGVITAKSAISPKGFSVQCYHTVFGDFFGIRNENYYVLVEELVLCFSRMSKVQNSVDSFLFTQVTF